MLLPLVKMQALLSHAFIDVIFCVGLIAGAVFGFRYITRKSTIFRIDYAGGNIAFDLVFASQDEAENFNKALRNANSPPGSSHVLEASICQ